MAMLSRKVASALLMRRTPLTTVFSNSFGGSLLERPASSTAITHERISFRSSSSSSGSNAVASTAGLVDLLKRELGPPFRWRHWFIAAFASCSAFSYYLELQERRAERDVAMVVDEQEDGTRWSPNPNSYSKRKFVPSKWGWFPEEDAFGAGKPPVGGTWSLIDLDGNLVTEQSFKGKYYFLYFGFARCPDICPAELVKVGLVLESLKENNPEIYKRIVPIFVSIDPARDSLKALKSFAKDFHPDCIFLTGTPLQVQEMSKIFNVFSMRVDEQDDGDYLVDHSIVTYFLDENGECATFFNQGNTPESIKEKIVELFNFDQTVLPRASANKKK